MRPFATMGGLGILVSGDMHSCNNCNLIVDSELVYCPRCGLKLVDNKVGRRHHSAGDAEIMAVLAEARALKAKSLWAEAIEKCLDALKRDPDSPEVYAALGEIYEAQGRYDQALHWYQMADAENSAYGPMVRSLQEKVRRMESRSGHHATGWFDRIAAAPTFVSSMRIITTAMVGFLAILVLSALVIVGLDRLRDKQPGADIPQVNQSPMFGPVGPPANPGNPSKRVAAEQDKPEKKLMNELIADLAIQKRQIAIKDVVIDPRHRQVFVQFVVSPFSGQLTRAQVIDDSAVVCSAVYRISPEAARATIYALADLDEDSPLRVLTRVFAADTDRKSSAEANPSLPREQIERMFMNPWWHAKLAM